MVSPAALALFRRPRMYASRSGWVHLGGYYSGADIWWNPFGQGTYGIHDLTGLLDGCRDD